LSPEETETFKKVKGINFHIGKGIFVKTNLFNNRHYLEIRAYDVVTGKANFRRGINVSYEYLAKLKKEVEAAVQDFESGEKIF